MRLRSPQQPALRDRPQLIGARIYSPPFFRDEVQFVNALRVGRSDAQAELLRRYHDRVAVVLQRVLGDHADLTGAVQEVFARAIVEAPRFDGPSAAIEQWLTKIAVSRAARLLRRRLGWRRFVVRDAPVEQFGRMPVAISTEMEIDTVHHTYAIFDTLPANERIALTLELLDEMPLSDIAKACRTSTSTIRRRLARAHKRFDILVANDAVLASVAGASVARS